MIRINTSLILIFYSFLSFTQQNLEFNKKIIAKLDDNHLWSAGIVDIDNDGDHDFVIGTAIGDIFIFENQGNFKFKKYLVGENALTDRGAVIIDVDGDGLLDIVAGATWFKNSGDFNKKFIRYENGGIYAYDMIKGDINSDGKEEIIAMSSQEGLFWYDFAKNPYKKWIRNRIDDGITCGIYPAGLGDINKDGKIDIVRSNVWYENQLEDGKKWIPHKTISYVNILGKFAYSSRVYVVDMDGDGTMDIIQSEANIPNGKIGWHRNKDRKGANWFTINIAENTKQDMICMCVDDFDNDGDLDIISGGGPMTEDLYKRVFIYINIDGKGEKWQSQQILFDSECHQALSADFDGDGDKDILILPWNNNEIIILENLLH